MGKQRHRDNPFAPAPWALMALAGFNGGWRTPKPPKYPDQHRQYLRGANSPAGEAMRAERAQH